MFIWRWGGRFCVPGYVGFFVPVFLVAMAGERGTQFPPCCEGDVVSMASPTSPGCDRTGCIRPIAAADTGLNSYGFIGGLQENVEQT